jgi:hypothetical protein
MLEGARGQYQELECRREVAEGLRGTLAVLNSNCSLDAILDYFTARAKKTAACGRCWDLPPGARRKVPDNTILK